MSSKWSGSSPVLITGDSALADSVARVAAVVGVPLEMREPGAAVPGGRLVLVGIDAFESGSSTAPTGAGGETVVIVRGEFSDDRARAFARLAGATHIIGMPEGSGWLADRLAGLVEGPSRRGALIGMISGVGGCGASTLAGSVAIAAAPNRRVILIDGDPYGPGADSIMGAEDRAGLRWGDLAAVSGRIPGATLVEGLPEVDGVHVLSHGRTARVGVGADAWASVLEAAARAFDVVVVDVGARRDPGSLQSLHSLGSVVLLTRNDLAGVVGAGKALSWVGSGSKVLLACRESRHRLDAEVIHRFTGLEPTVLVPGDPRLPRAWESSDTPGRGGRRYRRASRRLVSLLVPS